MLASLLPGLRDVRTPLTVGYLWLFTAWLVLGEHVPKSRPPGNGLVAQLFDLGGLLGRAAPIAALSFVAYLLGALLTIPVETRLVSSLLSRIGLYSEDTRSTADQYAERRDELRRETQRRLTSIQSFEATESDLRALEGLDASSFAVFARMSLESNDLRARLLVANQQMYGEYDRLAAEASFRVNMAPPLIALGFLVIFDFNALLGLGIMTAALILLVQGAIRLSLSNTVLRRAVLDGVIKDRQTEKLQDILNRAVAST